MKAETNFTKCPGVAMESLDELWFQVAGTRCNLECSHCFISCSPKNDNFGYLTLAEVERRLKESVALGFGLKVLPVPDSMRW